MSIEQKKVLALIPARGGSKSIPRKNVVDFAGKPLLLHTVELAKRLRYVDEVIVSTDDDEIQEVALQGEVRVVERPEELSQDNSKISDLLRHLFKDHAMQEYDLVVLLQPTSPLRNLETVEDAIETFESNMGDYTSLMPLTPIEPKVGHIENGSYVPIFSPGAQRQEMRPLYAECGTVFVYSRDAILDDQVFDKVLPFVVRRVGDNVDIDSEEDLWRAEELLRSSVEGKVITEEE